MTTTRKFRNRTIVLGTISSLYLMAGTAFGQAAPAPAAPPEPANPTPVQPATAPVDPAPMDAATGPAPQSASPTTAANTPASAQAQAPGPLTATDASAKPVEPAKEETVAASLATGDGGNLKVSGLLQVWGLYQHQKDLDPPGNSASTLRVRRAEIKVSGDLIPKKFSFGVMIDAAKAPRFGSTTVVTPPEDGSTTTGTTSVLTPARDNSVLQDIYLTYQTPWFDISAGQFKTPLSYESNTSSSKLFLPERSLVARTYGEQREMGVKIEKKFEYVGFVLGAYNGSGINRTDDNMQKDIALRLEAYPVKGITLGAVGYTSVGQRDREASTKDRVEGDLSVHLGDLVVQGEYLHGWDGAKGARVEGAGWYGLAGYTFGKVVQPVIRVGQFDRNVDTDKDTLSIVEAGVNYYVLKDSVKFQAAYLHTGSQAAGVTALNEVVLAGQYKF